MTIETTNINAECGDAVHLTAGDDTFFTIANGVVIRAQGASGIVADSTQSFFVYNYGNIEANSCGVELVKADDHFYNERSGSLFWC
jgi:hypothetical protein